MFAETLRLAEAQCRAAGLADLLEAPEPEVAAERRGGGDAEGRGSSPTRIQRGRRPETFTGGCFSLAVSFDVLLRRHGDGFFVIWDSSLHWCFI